MRVEPSKRAAVRLSPRDLKVLDSADRRQRHVWVLYVETKHPGTWQRRRFETARGARAFLNRMRRDAFRAFYITTATNPAAPYPANGFVIADALSLGR